MRNVDDIPILGVAIRDILPYLEGESCWQRMENYAIAVMPTITHHMHILSLPQQYEHAKEVQHGLAVIRPHIACTGCGHTHPRHQYCPKTIAAGVDYYATACICIQNSPLTKQMKAITWLLQALAMDMVPFAKHTPSPNPASCVATSFVPLALCVLSVAYTQELSSEQKWYSLTFVAKL